MKMIFKRILSGSLAAIMILSLAALAGCGRNEEEIVYELTPVTEEELETGCYYVKSGDQYYKMPDTTGRASFDGDSLVAKEASSDRTLMFGQDDVFIPTLYKDDMLIYVTKEAIPTSFTWERYEDDGYTIGVAGLSENEAGRYTTSKTATTVKADSSFGQALADVADEETIIIDKVDNTSVSNANISTGGSITGLTYGTEYTVDTYVGSEYIEAKATADTHVFTSFELYETSTYDFAQANYIVLTVPSYLRSGYYLINGTGFVKYANATREEGIAGINFNSPYYLGTDESGNVITADDVDVNTGEETDIPRNTYTSSCYIDCTNESMTVQINYSDVLEQINGVDLNVPNAVIESMEGVPLSAILTGPDGSEYTFEPSYEQENQLQCVVQMPLSGNWTVTLNGFDLRTFDINYTFVSGHSDTIIHSGSGKANLTYYLNNSMENAIFTIEWENKDRAAEVEIKTEDGTVYSKAEDESCILEEGYGYTKILVPNAAYGNYEITVSGDNLGRVRVTTEESRNNETVAETAETSIEESGDSSAEGTETIEE